MYQYKLQDSKTITYNMNVLKYTKKCPAGQVILRLIVSIGSGGVPGATGVNHYLQNSV